MDAFTKIVLFLLTDFANKLTAPNENILNLFSILRIEIWSLTNKQGNSNYILSFKNMGVLKTSHLNFVLVV